MNDLYDLARNVGPQLPSLLTLLICMVVVLTRWRRHPKVSLVATLGLFLIVLHTLLFAAADVWLPRLFLDKGSLEPDRFYAILGLTASLTLAIAFAVLLIAIFMDRKAGEREL